MRKLFVLMLLLCVVGLQAQELNCAVKINYDRVTNANNQIFKTLEKSLTEFVNNTKWSGLTFKKNERIDCSMFINVSAYNSDQFTATIQVQSSRPVYNSSYSSPVFNFNDKDFNFKYVEFENLYFDPNSHDSNLVSVIAYYANIIIGIDADTFTLNGGTPYYQVAQTIMNVSQQSNYKGWKQSDGNQNRYFLITDILSNTYGPFREALYQYHYEGMDLMSENQKEAKEKIKTALATLDKLHKVRPNAFLTRVFFDAKSDEIVSVFTDGPKISVTDLLDNLNRISPLNSSKWGKITY
ncbi:DUF4835 family protein [Flavobacterium sp. '19STA2R22 D10 B1']|uniref:type IX secretion system protein PorD n=1 Tax=Flavobacterium aerium TaxID=3037261 RepID=UPI00278C5F1E|nr:DUF4835 family protein [Flavobacterium sp. '19STA2R22 D10 B1']